MKKRLVMVLAVVVLAGWATALGAGAAEVHTDVASLASHNNDFALDLYAKLREQEGNLFFSPFSISTALGMTYAGARGETGAQMAKVLRLPTDEKRVDVPVSQGQQWIMRKVRTPWPQDRLHPAFKALVEDLNARQEKGAYQLSVANALWGQKGYTWLDEFLKVTRDNYGAGLREVDFVGDTEGARKTINDWAEKQTKDKIKELVPPGVLDDLTRLVLTNAIYFKGNWASQFKETATQDAPFTLVNGEKVEVPMMRQTGESGYMETEGFQALELPYVENELSMVVFLPKKMDGLAELEKSFTAYNLARWLPELRKREAQVELPRFKMTSEFRLDDVLKSLGMTYAFTGNADFSGMDGKKDLSIGAVLHKAFVDVNEEGTEAAAATAVVVRMTAAPAQPIVFCADHPFLFLIRDNRTGSILFMGRLTNPP